MGIVTGVVLFIRDIVPPFYSVLIDDKGLTCFECSGQIGYDEPSQIPN